ncbi:MAG: DUF7948 domain-containing protein [Anaerolineae bacterium]
MTPFGRLETSVNYFLGNDPAQWRTDVPVYAGVRYNDLYPGVDLEVTGGGGRVALRLRVEGAEALAVAEGGLRITTAAGEFALRFLAAVTADGLPLGLTGVHPVVEGAEVVSPFSVSPLLPPSIPAQDNPSDLLYATFLGGLGDDSGYAIAVDGAGNAYVTGSTSSVYFPTTPGAFDTSYNGDDNHDYNDAFVVQLDAAGSGLVYATFLGGGSGDGGSGIAVDAVGNTYVTGVTYSSDFPTTPGCSIRHTTAASPTPSWPS